MVDSVKTYISAWPVRFRDSIVFRFFVVDVVIVAIPGCKISRIRLHWLSKIIETIGVVYYCIIDCSVVVVISRGCVIGYSCAAEHRILLESNQSIERRNIEMNHLWKERAPVGTC